MRGGLSAGVDLNPSGKLKVNANEEMQERGVVEQHTEAGGTLCDPLGHDGRIQKLLVRNS